LPLASPASSDPPPQRNRRFATAKAIGSVVGSIPAKLIQKHVLSCEYCRCAILGLNQWHTRLQPSFIHRYDRESTRISDNLRRRWDIENRCATASSDNEREPSKTRGCKSRVSQDRILPASGSPGTAEGEPAALVSCSCPGPPATPPSLVGFGLVVEVPSPASPTGLTSQPSPPIKGWGRPVDS
jgi:hypothetical protein